MTAFFVGKLYIGCNDNSVRTVVAGGNPPPVVSRGHADWVSGLALSPDGKRIASGSLDGTVRLWNEADGRPLAVLIQLTPGTDEWLISTTPGFLATSSPDSVQWRTKNVAAAPADIMTVVNDSKAVRKILAGEKVAPPSIK